MRKFITAVIPALAFVSCAPAAAPLAAPAPAVSRDGSSLSAVMVQNWSTLRQLAADSDVILVGSVEGTAQRPYGPLPFTEATIRVERLLKGAVPAHVAVLQTGGLMRAPKGADPANYVPEEVGFEGIPVTKVGERYLFFLQKYVGPVTPSAAYVVVGEFQGKLRIEPTGRFGFAGQAQQIGEAKYATHRAVFGRTEQDVVTELSSY